MSSVIRWFRDARGVDLLIIALWLLLAAFFAVQRNFNDAWLRLLLAFSWFVVADVKVSLKRTKRLPVTVTINVPEHVDAEEIRQTLLRVGRERGRA